MTKQINILGDIIQGEDYRWFNGEVTPQNVIDALKEAAGEPVEIFINSNGGSVAGGLAIANAIKAYSGEVTCNVIGVAASMASVIACAGAKLNMGMGSFLMIHNPWARVSGEAEDLRKQADVLDKMRDSIISFYQTKTSKSADELKALMDAETWIQAESAADFGFTIETYAGEMQAAASLTRDAFDSAPEAAKALLDFRAEKPAPKSPMDWEARFKGASKKINELQAALTEVAAEKKSLQERLEVTAKDLAEAQANASNLSAKLDESEKALRQQAEDLAKTRDSLKAAEDKAAELEAARDTLTAGVLTPANEGGYAERMKAAKTPAEREELRRLKAAGKIK